MITKHTLEMKSWKSCGSKPYLLVFLFLLIGIVSSAQDVTSMHVYRSQVIIFEKAVSEIDSVKFYKTAPIGLNTSAQVESMSVYRSGAVVFEKIVTEIDSVTFYKTSQVIPLEITGTLTPSIVQGCSIASAPAGVETVAALELMPGSITIKDTGTAKEFLAVSSSDVVSGTCPILITRTYTIKDDCNNRATFVHSITIQDTIPPVVAGKLLDTIISGCPNVSAPAPATTISVLESLPGPITINDACTPKASLTISSADVVSGPTTITRTYTIKDACNNIVSVVHTITIQTNSPISSNAVFIPAGSFMMGSPDSEIKWDTDVNKNDETQHQVTLSSFYMSKYEVTNSEFVKFLNDKQIGQDGIYQGKALLNYGASWFEPWGVRYLAGKWIPYQGYENHPVVFETWDGAVEYAHYVGGRLPTEAEWEYACRAGTTTPFNTGNCLTNLQANYDWVYHYIGCQNSTTGSWHTEAVNSYGPNAWGLHNMHGNVAEWCSDWYGPYPSGDQTNPTGSAVGTKRVSRGGGNTNVAHRCRSAFRGFAVPEYSSSTTGFRVAFSCTGSN